MATTKCPHCGILNEEYRRICWSCVGSLLEEELDRLPLKKVTRGSASARSGLSGNRACCPGCETPQDVIVDGDYACDSCGTDFRFNARLGVLAWDSEIIREVKRRYKEAYKDVALQIFLIVLLVLIPGLVMVVTNTTVFSPVLLLLIIGGSLYYFGKRGFSVWSCPACEQDLSTVRGSPKYTLRCPSCGVQIDNDLERYES